MNENFNIEKMGKIVKHKTRNGKRMKYKSQK